MDLPTISGITELIQGLSWLCSLPKDLLLYYPTYQITVVWPHPGSNLGLPDYESGTLTN